MEELVEARHPLRSRDGRAATLGTIAEEAGVARSVLYQHISTRQPVLCQHISTRQQLLTDAAVTPFIEFLESFRDTSLSQLQDRRRSTWDMEREYISGILDHFTNHQHIFETVLSERSALSDSIQTALRRALEDVIEELIAVVMTECETHRPDVPLATMGLAIAMVIGVSPSANGCSHRAAPGPKTNSSTT